MILKKSNNQFWHINIVVKIEKQIKQLILAWFSKIEKKKIQITSSSVLTMVFKILKNQTTKCKTTGSFMKTIGSLRILK